MVVLVLSFLMGDTSRAYLNELAIRADSEYTVKGKCALGPFLSILVV
jgi:hypothetical protein